MKTKFELGEEVFVKGNIAAMSLDGKSVKYVVNIKCGDGTLREIRLSESTIERRVQQ